MSYLLLTYFPDISRKPTFDLLFPCILVDRGFGASSRFVASQTKECPRYCRKMCWTKVVREAKPGGFQTRVFPTFFGNGPDCVADPFGTVPRRC